MNDTNNSVQSGAGSKHNPLLRFIDIMLQDAHKQNAEEIHLVTSPESLTVKYMIDGDIKEAMAPPLFLKPQLMGTLRDYFQLPKSGAEKQSGIIEKKDLLGNKIGRFILEPFVNDARFIVIIVEHVD